MLRSSLVLVLFGVLFGCATPESVVRTAIEAAESPLDLVRWLMPLSRVMRADATVLQAIE